MWYAVHGNLGDPDFAIYEEYDDVAGGADPNNPGTNQLVETVSHDGVNFTPLLNEGLTTDPSCAGGGALNCVTNDEGIPGNQVLSKDGKTLYIAHTSADGNKVTVSIGTLSKNAAGKPSASWKTVQVNKDMCPDANGKPGVSEQCGAALFATIAQDTAGNLYVVSASKSQQADGTQTSPYGVLLWHSTNGGMSWGTASKASSGGSNAFPWITAGDPGRVDITYYHATESNEGGKFAFDDLKNGSFTVELAQSLNALNPYARLRDPGYAHLQPHHRQRAPGQVWPDLHRRAQLHDQRRRPEPGRLPAGQPRRSRRSDRRLRRRHLQRLQHRDRSGRSDLRDRTR